MRKKSEGSTADRNVAWRSLWEKMSQQDKTESKKEKKIPFHHGVMYRAITCKEILFLLLSTAKAAAGINFPCFEKAKGHMESAQKRVGRIA